MTKHQWECDGCGHVVQFRQPELPGDNVESEQNEERTCLRCNGQMYFDEVLETKVQTKAKRE